MEAEISNKSTTSAADSPIVFPLYFKDAATAFKCCCRYMESPLFEGCYLPALVMDGKAEFGTITPLKNQDDGTLLVLLLVASSDGGFTVISSTNQANGPMLKPGSLVGWRAVRKAGNTAQGWRRGWSGVIENLLRPEFRDDAWVVIEPFQL